MRSTGFSDDDFVVVDAVCGVVEDVDEFDEMRIDEESKIIEEQHEYEEEQAWLSYLEEQYAEGASKI